MTPKYVRAAFKRGGFPLAQSDRWNWEYESSVVRIRYQPDNARYDLPTIRVYMRGRSTLSEFDSPARALRCIWGRLNMTAVAGNDFALNTGPRGQLRLIRGAA